MFNDPFFRMFEERGPVRAHEMVKQYRRDYYQLDAQLNKAKRAVEMHPEKYAMGFTISPTLIYEVEQAKMKYEMALELQKMLDSKPVEKKKSEGNIIVHGKPLTVEDIRKAVKKLKGENPDEEAKS